MTSSKLVLLCCWRLQCVIAVQLIGGGGWAEEGFCRPGTCSAAKWRCNWEQLLPFRGQNVGNFMTDRPSSRVLAPPGGGSQISFGAESAPTPDAKVHSLREHYPKLLLPFGQLDPTTAAANLICADHRGYAGSSSWRTEGH